MSQKKVINGVTYILPDDVTEAEVAQLGATPPHPEAKMSAAVPGGSGIAMPGESDPNAAVTLGDVIHDPVDAMKRIGAATGRDLSDPKLWLGMLAGYFGPKAIEVAGPAVATAARGAMRVGKGLASATPEVIGLVSPRAGNAARIVQRVGQSLTEPQAPTEAPQPSAPAETPRELTARVRAEYRAANPAPAAETPVASPSTPQTAPAAAPAASVAKNPDAALRQARATFDAAKEAPRPGELNRAMNFILWGKSPEDALTAVIAQRGGAAAAVDPAAELLKRGIGVSDAEMNAVMRQRALSGTKSLMKKYGGSD